MHDIVVLGLFWKPFTCNPRGVHELAPDDHHQHATDGIRSGEVMYVGGTSREYPEDYKVSGTPLRLLSFPHPSRQATLHLPNSILTTIINMRVSVAFVLSALSMGVLATPMPSPAVPPVSVAALGGSDVLSSYSVTRVSMAEVRQRKEKLRDSSRKIGAFATNAYSSVAAVNTCTNGKAASTYSCSNVDMHGFLSHQAMGSSTREGNDIWGWTSPTGREFGVVGQTDGKIFVN
jgi:hypothetical protein